MSQNFAASAHGERIELEADSAAPGQDQVPRQLVAAGLQMRPFAFSRAGARLLYLLNLET